jgi:hypothetical protein
MAKAQQLEVAHEAPMVVSGGTALTPMEMLNAAVTRGDSIDKLERLMDLNDRWEKAQAKKAFLEAKAAFKAVAPSILRDKENKQYKSHYASIGNLVNTTNEALSKHGFDASWDYDQTDTTIKCTCTLKHVQGHSESVTLGGPPDVSGAKNPLQQIKSTTTYLRIATFEAVTGIATKDGAADDDGNGAGAATGLVSETQADEILRLIKNDKALETRILTWVGKAAKSDPPKTVSDIPARLYENVVVLINRVAK